MKRTALSLVAIALLSACAGQAPLPPKALDLNRMGAESLAQGDLVTAEARFALALEYHPKFVDALVNMGLLEVQRGNFKQAHRYLEQARSLNRHLAQPHHGLGVLREREGAFSDAATHYRDALEVDPGFVPSRANLARLYFEANRLNEAREQFLRLLEVEPLQPQGYVGLAETLFRLERADEAAEVIKRGVEQLGLVPELRLEAARVALIGEQYDDARVLLTTLLELRGPLAKAAWAWLGLTNLLQGMNKDAIACAERALQLGRDDALATYVLAMALASRGDSNANEWLIRAGELSGGNPTIEKAMSDRKY
jgi:tetratricopeptide (TPR) repeat protein